MDRKWIERYATGAAQVSEAIAGLSAADFNAAPASGGWTIGQIVLHLMDSDLIASDRMKRVIAEENPSIIGYKESWFAQRLFYDKQDPFKAAEIFRMNREMTAVILWNLPESAFQRIGTHNEAGKLTLEQLVQTYVEHLEHHLKFLTMKRAALKK